MVGYGRKTRTLDVNGQRYRRQQYDHGLATENGEEKAAKCLSINGFFHALKGTDAMFGPTEGPTGPSGAYRFSHTYCHR